MKGFGKLMHEIVDVRFPKMEDDEMIGDLMSSDNEDVVDNKNNRLSQFHHSSSRIIRVSRASGGKDRHSKVCTSKGPRDRRVRLSPPNALQLCNIQNRLGYDQLSKVVDWLIKAAEYPISELPSLDNTNFPTDDVNLNQEQTVVKQPTMLLPMTKTPSTVEPVATANLLSTPKDLQDVESNIGSSESQSLLVNVGDDEMIGDLMKSNNGDDSDEVDNNNNCLSQFHRSSRIIRASRASGGKDRHSKVCTSKGLRDQRVRLSVATAIQFYDLQDRLGYDQPSKAVDWLIKAAKDQIFELPSLNNAIFPTDDVNPNLKQTVLSYLPRSSKNLQDTASSNCLSEPQSILVDGPSSDASDGFEPLCTCVTFSADYNVVIKCGRGVMRNNDFISHLRAALCRRGISINEEFDEVDAVPKCSVLIILLTSSYVPSNLLHILEHQQKEYQVVYPIFYRLSPYYLISNFKSYERFFLQDEPKRWQAALKEITQIPGYTLTDKSESELIDEIVRDVLKVLCSGNKVNLIGMDMQVEDILSLLSIESLDVRSIGIWGTVGIGKTTIAEEIFRRISIQYETCVFFKDLHKEVEEKGHDAVREEFLSKLIDVEPHIIRVSDIKTSFLKSRLQHKRVLVILDNVNDYKDIETILGKLNFFGPGSRIVMTSRNRRVFVLCKTNHVYEVKPLDIPNSLLLLDHGTLRTVSSPEVYRTLSLELVKFSNGNPQVLQFLRSTDREWNTLFQEIQKASPMYIPDLFERSCCGLDDNERSIFLDIACFFRRINKDDIATLLDGCGFSAHVGFRSLVDKSLLTISHDMVDMLTYIQATGREMVHQESAGRPGRRSRLWNTEDIRDVFINDSGTSAIEGIFLDMSKLKLDANPNIFEKMLNLRLLKFYCSKVMENYRVSLPQGLKYLPSKLRLLHWEYYPLKSLPQSFDPRNLVELNLPSCSAEKLWKGKKSLEKLKKMRLSYSYQLTKLPRLSSAPNLELIDLEGCNSLISITQSISYLKKLVFLNLKDCSKLESVPSMVDLDSLEVLNLSGCSKLENFPEISPYVKELYMGGTMVQEIPSSIKNLVLLEKLDMENSRQLKNLPTSICKLKHLETLNLSGCTSLYQFPDLTRKMKCLRFLDLSRTAIKELPFSSISYLIALEELRFVDCRNLVRLPDNTWSLRFKVSFRQIDTEKFSRRWNRLGWLKKVQIT